jgi:hypothetical protein
MIDVKGKDGSKHGPVLKVRQVYSTRRFKRGKKEGSSV